MQKLKFAVPLFGVFMVILGAAYLLDMECRVFVTAHPLAAMCLVGFMMAVCAALTIWLTSENPFGPPSNEPIHRDTSGHGCCGDHSEGHHH